MKFTLDENFDDKRIINYNNTNFDIVPFTYTLKCNGKNELIKSFVVVAKGHNSKYGDMDIAIHCLDNDGDEIDFKNLEQCKKYLDNKNLKLKIRNNEYVLYPEQSDDELDEELVEESIKEETVNSFVKARQIAREHDGKISGPNYKNGIKVFTVRYRA